MEIVLNIILLRCSQRLQAEWIMTTVAYVLYSKLDAT